MVNETFSYEKAGSKKSWLKCRHVVILFAFLAEFYFYGLRIIMGVSIVAMVNNTALPKEDKAISESCLEITGNASNSAEQFEKVDGEFVWSPEIQGYVLGVSYLTYTLAVAPTGKLTEMLGPKAILFWGFFLSSLFTFLSPFAAWCNVYLLIVVQGLRGLVQASIIPAESALIANWCTISERGFSFTIVLSGSCVGAVVVGYISGLLCETSLLGGWPLAFFVTGGSGIIISLFLALFLYDTPSVHPNISQAELTHILENQENVMSKKRPKTPWCRFLTSVPVYALAYAYFGQMWALTYFLSVHSTFLGTILHYSIEQNGLFSALPFLIQIVTTVSSGWLSKFLNKKNYMSVDTSRKFWNFISCLGFSVCLLGMYFAGCWRSVTIVLSIISSAFVGFGYSGCWITSVDMSPTFAASLNAFSCTIGFLATFILPVTVGWLTDGEQTIEQWYKIMFISIAVVLSSGIVFAVFGSAKIQPWNDTEEKTEKKYENMRL